MSLPRQAMPEPNAATFPQRLPGLLLSLALAALALVLGRRFPLLGGPLLGIGLGLLVRNALPLPARYGPGIQFASHQLLQASVVALGFGLSLDQVAKIGLESLAVTLVTLSVALLAARVLGRWLGVSRTLEVLIGVGTAICGGSAIAAVAPIIQADEHDTAFALSTIFLFNLVAVLLFPWLGHLLQLSDQGFGLWAGTAINDTSSVVAAGYSFSTAAGDYATVVKLTRATLIVPVCLVLAVGVAARRRQNGAARLHPGRAFPWFILGFVAAAAARSSGWLPAALLPALHEAAQGLMVVALTAIGLSAPLRRLAATGPRPLLLGLGVWVSVALSSLLVQLASGRL